MLNETLQIPIDGETRKVIQKLAKQEQRRAGGMGRVLLLEAIQLRLANSVADTNRIPDSHSTAKR